MFSNQNTNYEFDHMRSPKGLRFQKTSWNQSRGNFSTLCPWSNEVKEDIARAFDKYTKPGEPAVLGAAPELPAPKKNEWSQS